MYVCFFMIFICVSKKDEKVKLTPTLNEFPLGRENKWKIQCNKPRPSTIKLTSTRCVELDKWHRSSWRVMSATKRSK